MSTFTIRLKDVITKTGGTVARTETGVQVMTGGNIGLKYYKPFLPEHKPILDGKIIDHYWNREIGQESISMFQLAMQRKLNEIMPYYNQLYQTETIDFDPMHTINIHTIAVGEELQNVGVESTTDAASDSVSKSRTVNSELPQVMLSGDGDYASSGVDSTTTTEGSSFATDNKTSDSITNNNTDTNVVGYQAYPANLINQYRSILLNIDTMILAELDSLFMQVWDTGDAYVPDGRYGWTYFL